MRPAPKRAAGGRATGAALASVSDESSHVMLISAGEHRLVRPSSPPEEASRSKEGQGEGNIFRVGDAVLASTKTRNPTLREATVVELDPSDGSRVKIAFGDKRKKGGWREKHDLSVLRRPHNNAGSASPAEQRPSDVVSSGGVDAGAAGFRTGPQPPERGSKSKTKTSVGGASSQCSEIAQDEPGQKRRRLSDTAATGAPESSGAAGTPAAAGEATGTPLGAAGCYRVGDTVLAITSGNPAQEATVVEVDPSDGSRFKIAFRNKRKKGGWRDKSELLSAPVLPRAANAGSSSARPPPSGSAPSLDASAARGGAPTNRNQNSAGVRRRARSQEARNSSGASGTAAGAKISTQTVHQSAQEKPAEPVAVPKTVENGGGISRSPKRKRSAAAAAAAAISSSSIKRRSGVSGGGGAATKHKPVQKKGTKANRRSNAATSGGPAGAAATAAGSRATTKTPRRKDWQRPKVVTPGSVEGRPELALRSTHPTEIVRPRRQFKVQQARVTPRAKSDGNVCSSTSSRGATHRSSFSVGLGGGGGNAGPRRMLCQPAHSVRDANPGLSAGGGKGSGRRGGGGGAGGGRSVEGPEEENDDSHFVRRGRRVRRQVHPSLSEDTMAAVNGGVQSDFDDSSDGEGGDAAVTGGGGAYGDAPFRFRTSEAAPWGQGDRPLMKVRLSLLEGGGALSAERSALAVVTFVSDRHRYSGEQLANVLTAEGFLCYRDEDTRVFVLTESKKPDQAEALRRVRELALSRCGVEVEVAPWLEGRPALDEFLDNHRRVLDHIVRHRLACGMWTEVGGVYFNALFCGRRSKRTFNGVRLGINLAVDHNRALESGVWEVWITVEPAVHRFSPVDWWALMNEKEDKGLQDFSGSKSDDLEERLQVVCLPKLSRGVVHDVKEDAFEMDILQEANLKRGYLIGPTSEDEMVEYWRQVHHLNLPSTNFQFVKVRIGGMVLTYPSWCVVRGQREVPDATRAMRSRILDSFANALDGMEGVRVMETTFPWPAKGRDGGAHEAATTSMAASGTPGMFDNALCWATAGGRTIQHPSSSASPSPPSTAPDVVAVDEQEHARDRGVTRDGDGAPAPNDNCRATPLPSTPSSAAAAGVDGGDGKTPSCLDPAGNEGDRSTGGIASVVTPHSSSAPTPPPPPPPPLMTASRSGQQQSPESMAAAAAAQAAVGVVRQSFVRRRGTVVPRRVPLAAAEDSGASGAAPESSSAPRLCSTPFVIRRQPPPPGPPSAAGVPAGSSTGLNASGGGSSSRESGGRKGAVKRRPLDLSAGEGTTKPVRGSGGRADGAGPATPRVGGGTDGGGAAPVPPPTATRVMTPAADGEAVTTAGAAVATAAAGGARRKKRKELKTVTPQEGGESSDREGRKRSKKTQVAAAAAARGEGADGASATGVADADAVQAAPLAPIVVAFSAEGSLGMGMEADASEEGTMCLAGKAPTSAAAAVPDGWRITAVNGKCARRLGDEKIAALLTLRPVEITFEEVTKAAAPTSAPAAPRKRAAPTKSKAAPVTKPKAGTKGKALKGKGKARAKKADKVTTVRKTFKVQARGGGGGGSGGGGGRDGTAAAVQASSTSAVI